MARGSGASTYVEVRGPGTASPSECTTGGHTGQRNGAAKEEMRRQHLQEPDTRRPPKESKNYPKP